MYKIHATILSDSLDVWRVVLLLPYCMCICVCVSAYICRSVYMCIISYLLSWYMYVGVCRFMFVCICVMWSLLPWCVCECMGVSIHICVWSLPMGVCMYCMHVFVYVWSLLSICYTLTRRPSTDHIPFHIWLPCDHERRDYTCRNLCHC